MENPYAAPQEWNDGPPRQRNSDLRWPRRILYFHVFAIMILGIFTLIDSGQLQVPALAQELLAGLAVPLVLAMAVCPLAMGKSVYHLDGRSPMFRFLTLIGDLFLSMVQLFVMLPLVQ